MARDEDAPYPVKRAKADDVEAALLQRVSPDIQPFVQEIMYTEGQIRDRAAQMGAEITKRYQTLLKPGEALIIIGLLKGALPFMNELITHIAVPTILEYISVHSYAGTETSGRIDFRHDMETDPKGQHCLLVDDIVDTGGTLEWAVAHLNKKGVASVQTALMLDKKERRTQPIDGDFVGFVIPNKFVVGFGLDFDQRMRNLPFVAVLAEAAYKK